MDDFWLLSLGTDTDIYLTIIFCFSAGVGGGRGVAKGT